MWIALLFLGLGTLAVVGALILLLLTIKNIKKQQYVLVPEKTITHIAKSKSTSKANTQAEGSDSIYSNSAGIVVDEEDGSENDYLRHVTDKIFRAYDIRGVVGEYINAEVFTQIAYGIAVEMAEQNQAKIAVACDGRDSSPELVKALIEALLASGIEVIDIGMVSSPVLYFAALTKADGNGVVVTASHNPANYNGMKIMLSGHSYSETRLQKLREKVIQGERISGKGQLSEVNIMEDYITKITGNIILARPMNVVIDSGNGIMGKFAPTFFEQLGCKVTALNSDVDGSFPVHDPDPSRPENMAELIEKIVEVKADLGIAFDGDGDRIGLVTSGGEIIWPDRILMLLAKDILSRNDDATIIYDVKSTRNLDTFIRELGGKPVMWKSGHSFMKSKLLETGALLAGEMSGHIFIKERWFGFDDALFVASRVLEILSIDLRKSRQVFAELPDSLNTPEILIASEQSVQVIEKLANDLSCFDDAEVITIDGIRVHYSDGWGLVRSSNTTDNLTMRFEADSEEALQRIATTFKEALLAADPSLIFPF
ncbi:MAG: phosphomannomutase/phosphoglucomutase [Gammaproteobacteria bacterium]|nr:phosphomannomutase/phosphoglucomutase [Gammaproteobacteria bacterium]